MLLKRSNMSLSLSFKWWRIQLPQKLRKELK